MNKKYNIINNLKIAEENLNKNNYFELFYEYKIDRRGRQYPFPSSFSRNNEQLIRCLFEFSEGINLNALLPDFLYTYLIVLLKLYKKFFITTEETFEKDIKYFLNFIKENLELYDKISFSGSDDYSNYYLRILNFCDLHKRKDEIFENFRIYFEF
jgi:hypothetical protein